MRDLCNQTLGKYELIREVGRGSMGVVYLAHDPFADRDVAVKVAYPESLRDKEGGDRYRKIFFNEAKVAGLLDHPNIVAVYDAGVEGEICYIVMEFVSGGGTLQEHCEPDKLLPLQDVLWIIFKCAKALDYAHRKGVIHRDIKPGNILFTGTRDVKIADFGVALATRSDSTTTQFHGYVGSPLYMSPEQVREEDLTNQSDIFSIGVVMYQLLTGKHPFVADSLPAIVHRITRQTHTPVGELRSDVPELLGRILDRTLKKKAAARYKTGLDLAGDLSLVFDQLHVSEDMLSDARKFELVRDLRFFHDFPVPQIWQVLNASQWLDFRPGAEIVQEGEQDDTFFIIVSGKVTVRKKGRDVATLEEGDCFGEMGAIASHNRTASIVAKTDVSVLKVRATLIERASVSCQLRFHKLFLRTLMERLSNTTELAARV